MKINRTNWNDMTREERSAYMRQVRQAPRIKKTDGELLDRLMGRTVETKTGCMEFTGHRDPLGYGKITMRGKGMLAHRAAYVLSKGPIPDGMLVCHKCDNPPCINPDHLFIGTDYENTMDAVKKGRKFIPDSRGSSHGGSKITESDVKEIRRMSGEISQKKIGEIFDLNQATVSNIITKRTWKHVI